MDVLNLRSAKSLKNQLAGESVFNLLGTQKNSVCEKVPLMSSLRFVLAVSALVFTFSAQLLLAAEEPAPYRATEDVVYGHKDGLALTLDVLQPEQNPKGIGLILVSSGSWRSGKSDLPEQNDQLRKHDHWCQGLLKGGFTLFVVRHGSSPRYTV